MLPKKIKSDFVLDKFSPNDGENLFKAIDKNRAFLRKRLPWLDHNKTVQDSINFIGECIKGYLENSSLILAIRHRTEIIGVVSFHQFDWEKKTSAVGYWLDEDFQGQGLISQACKILLEHGIAQMGLNKITISCAIDNMRSRAIAEKLGFQEVSIERKKEWLYDHFIDHVVYSISAEEWQKNASNKSPKPIRPRPVEAIIKAHDKPPLK